MGSPGDSPGVNPRAQGHLWPGHSHCHPIPTCTPEAGRACLTSEGRDRGSGWASGMGSPGRDEHQEPQLARPHPSATALQVIPQGVTPSPCIPCCLVITDDRIFTCHEDCQTSFFRSLGTAELADISAVSTEPGREYCVLVSRVGGDGGMEAGPWKERELYLLTWARLPAGVLPGQPAAPATLGHLPELHV